MLLIRHGYLKPIEGEDISDGEILIDGGKIAAIGRGLDVPEGTEVYDAQGFLVTPGFVEAHCHIGIHEESVRWEGNDTNEYSNPITPELRAIDGINPMCEAFRQAIAGGVTAAATGPGSANVLGGTFCALKLAGSCVDDMVIRDPIAMKAAFGENPKNCYGNDGKKRPVTRMAVAALLREELEKARRYNEACEEAERDLSKAKPAYDMQLEALRPVIRRELPLKVHAHRADDILTALRIAREFDIELTLDHVTEGHLIVKQLSEAGKPVLVGPSLTSKSKYELHNRTFATPGILAKAGLSVSIITDAPVIPLCYLPLCAGLAVKAGMDEAEAWRAITINPARAIGIDSRVGSLSVGKDADIAVFDGNPLRDICCCTKQVFVNGKPQL